MSRKPLSEVVIDFVKDQGAVSAGICTVQSLTGGPETTDLSYILPGAKSAITYAVPIDQKYIEDYFRKKDFNKLEKKTYEAYTISSGISMELATYLKMRGFESAATASNRDYRQEVPGGNSAMVPSISHRFLAVRSGVGHFGLSGNIIINGYGAAVVLGTVVTTAELEATEPLAEKDNYCDHCGICAKGCASNYVEQIPIKVRVSMGGKEFSFRKSKHVYRCGTLCAGYVGLEPDEQWSTWSPSRRKSPATDGEIPALFPHWAERYNSMPMMGGGFFHILMDSKIRTTCAHCQFICSHKKEERKQRLQWLEDSGVIIQLEDGSLKAVTPEEARTYLDGLSPERRALYEDT